MSYDDVSNGMSLADEVENLEAGVPGGSLQDQRDAMQQRVGELEDMLRELGLPTSVNRLSLDDIAQLRAAIEEVMRR